MQKIQILRGTPGPTFKLVSTDAAKFLALQHLYKTNLIANGDAEADSNWANYGTPAANSRSTVKVVTGQFSRLFTPNAANEGIKSDAFTVAANEEIGGVLRVYPDDGTVVSVIILGGDGTAILTKTFTGLTVNAWNQIEFKSKNLVAGALAQLVVHSGEQTSGDFYIADVFMSKLNSAGRYAARKASGARITVDTNDIRYAFGGTTPVMAATDDLGHLVVDPDEFFLDNFDALASFKYVSNVTSTAGNLNITPEF